MQCSAGELQVLDLMWMIRTSHLYITADQVQAHAPHSNATPKASPHSSQQDNVLLHKKDIFLGWLEGHDKELSSDMASKLPRSQSN